MEFSLAFHKSLLELFRLLDNPCGVLLVHSCEDAHELLCVALRHRTNRADVSRRGIFNEIELIFATFSIESVASAHVLELYSCAYVAGLKRVVGVKYDTSPI